MKKSTKTILKILAIVVILFWAFNEKFTFIKLDLSNALPLLFIAICLFSQEHSYDTSKSKFYRITRIARIVVGFLGIAFMILSFFITGLSMYFLIALVFCSIFILEYLIEETYHHFCIVENKNYRPQ